LYAQPVNRGEGTTMKKKWSEPRTFRRQDSVAFFLVGKHDKNLREKRQNLSDGFCIGRLGKNRRKRRARSGSIFRIVVAGQRKKGGKSKLQRVVRGMGVVKKRAGDRIEGRSQMEKTEQRKKCREAPGRDHGESGTLV